MVVVARRTPEEIQQAVLDAAAESLKGLTAVDLISAVGVREIARLAGISVTTMYAHFGSVEGLADAVVDRVFHPRAIPASDLARMIARIGEAGLPAEVALAYHHADFLRLSADAEMPLRLGLWGFGGPRAREANGRFLRETDRTLTTALGALVEAWGREVRPPLDLDTVIAAHVALLSGMVVRHSVDPEAIDADRFALLATVVLVGMLRLQGDQHTLQDRITAINYFPLHNSARVRLTDKRAQTRARILDKAAETIGREDVGALTMARLANAAGVGSTTMYQLFDNIEDVVVSLLLAQARDTFPIPAGEGTAGEGTASLGDLRARIEEVAEFLAARTDYVGHYSAELAAGRRRSDDSLRNALLARARPAAGAGILADDVEPAELADAVLLMLCSRLRTHPADGAQGGVEFLVKRVLPGFLA